MTTLSPETLLVASFGMALVPLVIAVGSCYLKFSIILSMLRTGFGAQQAPSASLVVALSCVMSLVVMQPVLSGVARGVGSLSVQEVGTWSISRLLESGSLAIEPWKKFLVQHAGERELAVFTSFVSRQTHVSAPLRDKDSTPLITALAAFVLTEIKKGFAIAFFLLIPFFVIDLIVANLLVAMGLTMMSPVVVSLPLKVLLLLSSDGWLLLAHNLIKGYQ